MKKLITLLCAIGAMTVQAITYTKLVEVTRTQTETLSAYRGETIDLVIDLQENRKPLPLSSETAAVYWQTNGMDAVWWTKPATIEDGKIHASWTPQMDTGASLYRLFIGVDDGSGKNYRANYTLRLSGSPGAVPNSLPLPVETIDFNQVEVLNAPWLETETDPVWIAASTDVLGHIGNTTNNPHQVKASQIEAEGMGIGTDTATVLDVLTEFSGQLNTAWSYIWPLNEHVEDNENPHEVTAAQIGALDTESDPYWHCDAPGVTNLIQDAQSNAEARAEEVKEWASLTYGDPNAWFAISGDELSVYQSTNAVVTNIMWKSSASANEAITNLQNKVDLHEDKIDALEARPDLTEWGRYASDGTLNPAPDEQVLINAPMLALQSGLVWKQSGAVAVLCSSGAVMFDNATDGEIRWGMDDGTNYISIISSGKKDVGARLDSIVVDDEQNPTEVSFDYTYPLDGDGNIIDDFFPKIWATADLLSQNWVEMSAVGVNNGDGTCTMTVATDAYRFFKATTSVTQDPYFRPNIPTHLPAGIYGNYNETPVIYDSTVTITVDGVQYRIPAQRVTQ